MVPSLEVFSILRYRRRLLATMVVAVETINLNRCFQSFSIDFQRLKTIAENCTVEVQYTNGAIHIRIFNLALALSQLSHKAVFEFDTHQLLGYKNFIGAP